MHFCNAHHQLQEIIPPQQQQSLYHANAVCELLDKLKNELCSKNINTPTTEDSSISPSLTGASTFSHDSVSAISAIQSEISSLQKMVLHMTTPTPPESAPPAWPVPPLYMQYHPMYCQQMVPPMPTQQWTPQPQQPQKKCSIFYCWTHGACLHYGDRCINQIPGHCPMPHSKTDWEDA